LGRIAARLLQIRGEAIAVIIGEAKPCDERLSCACVIEKNLAWSELGQYHCLNFDGDPGTGIAALKWAFRRPGIKRLGGSSGTLNGASLSSGL
jgi:hypothetical protein